MNRINTRKALNPEYRKHKPRRKEVNAFRTELKTCLVSIKEAEEAKRIGEEFIKQPIQKFLENTFYKDHLINTKDRIDLAIYTGKEVKTDVGVILELKQPSNKTEYLTETNLNKKALQELLWYYLNERIDGNNNNIKHLIATNGYTWFLFKSEDFYNLFYKNKSLVKEYKSFKEGLKDSSKTELFYKEIASKYIAEIEDRLPFVYLDFTKKSLDSYADPDLNTLFKVFSDVNILGKSFGNDSNELNKEFYLELLHIIGLEEFKENGKKLIYRKKEKERDYASLLENTIFTLEDKEYLKKVKRFTEDKAFNAGLALCLTWINRILFLKLLESQLRSYHSGSKEYKFLNSDFVGGFDDLNDLFFSALAKKTEERHPKFKDKYKNIPFLNSSLFEKNDLETDTFDISALNDDEIDVYKGTVLKEAKGKRLKGKLSTLDYLFKFLDAFDFAADGTEAITEEEETKTLISASVLGKIFEKLNGYKDGSFYTPSHITMYMCKETLRKAISQKFKEHENEQIETYEDLTAYCHNFFKHEDRKRLNDVFNSLKVCDPAVGSGHFLVSALNELILIKHELGLLIDAKGKRLSDYDIEVINDELNITDEKGFLIAYKPDNKESARVQHTLFHEKRTIIENCLFGVDINPNSVKICRLRLWIELLKNAYYTNTGLLETLPNIDINIKCGNSLISRFALDDDLTKSFKGIGYNFKDYQKAVKQYKDSQTKEEKIRVLTIIKEVKNNFKSSFDSKALADRKKIEGKYENEKTKQENLVSLYKQKITKAEKDKLVNLKEEAEKALAHEKEIKNNVIYENAFEWRFEFPEVLDDKGDFVGFDLVIGNPPYIKEDVNREAFNGLHETECYQGKMDLWYIFGDLGLKIVRPESFLCFIATNNWVTNSGASNFRKIVLRESQIINITDFGSYMIFENASIQTMIILFKKNKICDNYLFNYRKLEGDKNTQDDVLDLLADKKNDKSIFLTPKIVKEQFQGKTFTFNSSKDSELLIKIKTKQNFFLREKPNKKLRQKAEIGSGIDVLQDFVSKKNVGLLNGQANSGDGVFVLNNSELEKQKFSKKEKEIIKPYYTTEQLQKYYGNSNNNYWILYTKSDIGKPDKKTKRIPINDYPKIKKHLDKFRNIITSDNKPYGLHRTREQHLFEEEKIFALRKCPSEPKFTYTNFDCFVSRAFLIVQSDRINLKYLTGLFNSKLISFWLYRKGKLQGNSYQIDKGPLLEIPIYKPSDKEINEIVKIVDKILNLKQQDKDITEFEKQIDQMVYKLYDLTEGEIKNIIGEK